MITYLQILLEIAFTLFPWVVIFLAIGIVRYNKKYFGAGFTNNSLML